jgi:dethiobiotin synthetase
MSFPLPPEAAGYQPKGVLVAGIHPKSGKTVACAGLAGALGQLGFRVQAIKPFSFLPRLSVRRGTEQEFFNRVMPPIEPVDPFSTESAHTTTAMDWQRLLETSRKRIYPFLLEAPGCVASPIRYMQDEVTDVIDLAKALKLPILLVMSKQPDPVALLAPIFAYLWHRDAEAIGWLAVETSPTQAPDWDAETLFLGHYYRIPYLGEIAYSPSISVEAMQQGNVIRTTEAGVDLLPIQQVLELGLPKVF